MRTRGSFPAPVRWAFTALLLAGSFPGLQFGTELLPHGPPALLSQTGWAVPISRIPGINHLLEWETPWYFLLGSWVIVLLAERCRTADSGEQLLLIVGLSGLMRPADVGCAAVMVHFLSRTDEWAAPQRIRSWWLAAFVSVFVTLEFGLILAVVLAEMATAIVKSKPDRGRIVASFVVLLLVLGLAAAFLPGFDTALLRPWSRLLWRQSRELLPSLSSVWHAPELCGPFVLSASALGIHNRMRPGPLPLWKSATVFFLAVLSQRWTCLWLMYHAMNSSTPGLTAPVLLLSRRMKLVAGGLAVAWVAWNTGVSGFISSGAFVTGRIDPTRWESAGVVLLTNLDRSAEWRTSQTRKRFTLLADDRWDAFSQQLTPYAALCRDLAQVRDHRYWRTDGKWGGYLPALETWSPTLLVVESYDVEAIRGLSLSPEWRIMGIDAQQVIFGRMDDAQNSRQIRHTFDTLLTLEWPARLEKLSLENTIVTASAADDRSVAEVLCALRFPYAAGRFTRQEPRLSPVRAQCMLELAHRAASHSATGSLLDQHRAVVLTNTVLRRSSLNSADSSRMSRGLRALLDCQLLMPEWVTDREEERLRRALLTGDTSGALQLLPRLPAPLQAYYRSLCDAPQRTAEEITQALNKVIGTHGADLPAPTLSEVHFYVGCAALESGLIDLAVPAFAASIQHDPDSVYREIRNLHVQQLSR